MYIAGEKEITQAVENMRHLYAEDPEYVAFGNQMAKVFSQTTPLQNVWKLALGRLAVAKDQSEVYGTLGALILYGYGLRDEIEYMNNLDQDTDSHITPDQQMPGYPTDYSQEQFDAEGGATIRD